MTRAAAGAPAGALPPGQHLLGRRAAFTVGVLGALGTVLLGLTDAALLLGSVGVAVLYAVYPLLALGWGTPGERRVETGWAMVGVATIALAVTLDPRWLALGWAAHGVWDGLHRRDHHVVGMRGIPPWYVSTCLVWDVVAAVGLLIVL